MKRGLSQRSDLGGVEASDEDVVEYDVSSQTWSMAFDGSVHDPEWASAYVDAIALPEAGELLGLVIGLILLRALARRRRVA